MRLRFLAIAVIALGLLTGCDEADVIRFQFAAVGADEATQEQAVRVATCESHLNPSAVGRYGELGLFQIYPKYHAQRASDMFGMSAYDALTGSWTNAAYAAWLWQDQGWRPWSSSKGCWQ